MVRMKLVAATSVLALSSMAFSQEQPKVERGKTVFKEQKCTVCHSIGGQGGKGPLDGVGSKLSAEEIKQWLLTPKAMAAKVNATRKPPMKAFTDLKADELEGLIAYLESLRGTSGG